MLHHVVDAPVPMPTHGRLRNKQGRGRIPDKCAHSGQVVPVFGLDEFLVDAPDLLLFARSCRRDACLRQYLANHDYQDAVTDVPDPHTSLPSRTRAMASKVTLPQLCTELPSRLTQVSTDIVNEAELPYWSPSRLHSWTQAAPSTLYQGHLFSLPAPLPC